MSAFDYTLFFTYEIASWQFYIFSKNHYYIYCGYCIYADKINQYWPPTIKKIFEHPMAIVEVSIPIHLLFANVCNYQPARNMIWLGQERKQWIHITSDGGKEQDWGDLIRKRMKYVRKCAASLLCLLRPSAQDIISTAAICRQLYKVMLQLSNDLFLSSNCNYIM